MISLGGLELNKYLQVPDWVSKPARAGSERTTFGGMLIVQRLPAKQPRLLTLTAVFESNKLYGYFKRSDVEAIRGLAESGEQVEFVFHDETVNVVVALDGISVEPRTRRTDPPADHPYYGTIQLYEV